MLHIFIDQYRHSHNKKIIYDSDKIKENLLIEPEKNPKEGKSPIQKSIKIYIRSLRNQRIRLVLIMRCLGFTYEEISQRTGLKTNNIKTLIHRGKLMIEEKFHEKINRL